MPSTGLLLYDRGMLGTAQTRSLLGLALVGTLVPVTGCAQLLGFDDVSARSEDAGIADARVGQPDAELPPDANVDPFFTCTSSQFLPDLGGATFNTESEADEVDPSCGSTLAPDHLVSWRAPTTDYYVFDTSGSSFDTVLALFDDCDGNELACNNNVSDDATSSEIVRKIERDTNLVVAVDGFAGDQGEGALNIARVTCPDSDLEGQTFPLALSTSSFGDDLSSSCGGDGQEDRAYHWIVPSDGLNAFKAVAPGFRPTISVIDGSRCSETELGCSKSAGFNMRAEVVRRLSAGQEVSIYVDGIDGAGTFELDVEERGTTCPQNTAPSEGQTQLANYGPRILAPSCGFPEVSDGIAGIEPLGDVTYDVQLPGPGVGCEALCTYSVESSRAFTVYLLENNDCSGAELACEESSEAAGVHNASVQVFARDNNVTRRTLVVAAADFPSAEEISVSVTCDLICA